MTNRIREFWEEKAHSEARRPGQVRGPREPSLRNRDIYHAVRTQGFTQEEMAEKHGISQTRVSQIVRQCDRWFASPQAAGQVVASPAGRKRLASYVDLARLETIYTLAMRDHQRSEKRQSATTSGTKDGRCWSQTTNRDSAVNSQPLRTALRALELMWQLDERQAGEGGVNSVSSSVADCPAEEPLPRAPVDATHAAERVSADRPQCKCGEASETNGHAQPGLLTGGRGD